MESILEEIIALPDIPSTGIVEFYITLIQREESCILI